MLADDIFQYSAKGNEIYQYFWRIYRNLCKNYRKFMRMRGSIKAKIVINRNMTKYAIATITSYIKTIVHECN